MIIMALYSSIEDFVLAAFRRVGRLLCAKRAFLVGNGNLSQSQLQTALDSAKSSL